MFTPDLFVNSIFLHLSTKSFIVVKLFKSLDELILGADEFIVSVSIFSRTFGFHPVATNLASILDENLSETTEHPSNTVSSVFWNQSLIVSSISVLCAVLCPRRLSKHMIRPNLQSKYGDFVLVRHPRTSSVSSACQGCRCHRCHHSIGNRLCCVVLAQFSCFRMYACQIPVQLGNISQPRSLFFFLRSWIRSKNKMILPTRFSVFHIQDGCSHLRQVLVLTHHNEVFDICGDELVIRSKHQFLDSLMEFFN